jgi:ubiquinone/menaquinone biosynthesis C-methylase UbiE
MNPINKDYKTVAGFGDEWERFDQSELSAHEHRELFDRYFKIFPWQTLPENAHGFDMGCGSGRWAKLVAPRVGKLHCIDPSSAIHVAERNLANQSNCVFHQAGLDDQVLPDASMDFGYSLGVLHHVPDTSQGIRDCVRMLKHGAPFLLYLYYDLDSKSFTYRALWKTSDIFRRVISRMPHSLRYVFSQLIAIFVYWPLSRFAALMECLGMSKEKANALPLGFYRQLSFYTMRTDALDRFGTRLEQRFTRKQIQVMMESAGLIDISFSDEAPYWCAVGIRKNNKCVA